jgi:hypothetical protein
MREWKWDDPGRMVCPVRKGKIRTYNWPATKDILRCCILGQCFSTSVLTYHYHDQNMYADHNVQKILITQLLYSSLNLYVGLIHKLAQSVQRLTAGWKVRGSNPGGGEIFRTCPDRPWGPPSLLYNGYQVFPGGGGVRLGPAADHSPPSNAAVMEE